MADFILKKASYEVILSASGEESDVQKAEAPGAADYIKKPFMPPALLECVNKALDK